MNELSSFRLATSAALCATLVACATADPAPPTVVRTAAPQGYEKTITNYLAFRIRGSQKNTEISFSPPEQGGCPLDGHSASVRGWVVPVVHATRTGEATGRETINIATKQYYFWFLGNTIAGITPRIELCPGVGSIFTDVAPPSTAAALPTAARDAAGERKNETASETKKTGASSGKTGRPAKKTGKTSGKGKSS